MKNSLLLGAALLSAVLLLPHTGRAESPQPGKTPPTGSGETKPEAPAKKANHSVPFRGKVAAVDSQQMTFTLSGPKQRVFHFSSESKIEKDGKPAAFADIVLGDEARGLYQSEDGGQLVILKASFGPKPDKVSGEAKTAPPAKSNEAGS